MAIFKPSNVSPNNISQDATEQIVVSWRNNGDRQYFYQIKIHRNSDNVLVHDTTKISTLNTFHVLPSNTLINGIIYKYQVTVWNQNNESAISDWIIFKCSSTPIVTFTNLISNDEILNDRFLFQGSYSQAENVPIKSWQMILYDNLNNLKGNSGEIFNSNIQYEFSGLNNDANYSIELQVKSQDNLLATTNKIPFSVRYEVPPLVIALEAENIREKAGIRLQWRIVEITGEGENYNFVDNNKIDVTQGKVWFSQGFNIQDDFTLKLWLKSVQNATFNINPNASIVSYVDPISNTSVMWLEDGSQLVETPLVVEVSNVPPINTNPLWIEDATQLTPKILNVSIDVNEPDVNTLWLDLIGNVETLELLKMKNEQNENISLRYFNGAFHLYKNNELVSSSSSQGENYYIYIQQIGDNLILHSEVV